MKSPLPSSAPYPLSALPTLKAPAPAGFAPTGAPTAPPAAGLAGSRVPRANRAEELAALLRRHSDYRDFAGLTLLLEYTSLALSLLQHTPGQQTTGNHLNLLCELVELRRKRIIPIPAWVDTRLEKTVKQALLSDGGNDPRLALPLLTLHMLTGDDALERKARRIINRCYREAFDDTLPLPRRIDSLHTAVTCCDYVTRFSPRKAAACWNTLATLLLTPQRTTDNRQRETTSTLTLHSSPLTLDSSPFTLQEIARELESFAPISPESKDQLTRLCSDHSTIVRENQTIEP